MFACRVTSLITCNQFRLFNQLIQMFNYLQWQWSFLSIFAKTSWFYCKRLQNDGALNFVHFFLGHSVCVCDRVGHTRQCRCHNTGRNLFSFNFLYFQSATSFHSDRGITISPSPRSHPTHGVGRRRGQSARRQWLLHSGDRVGSSGCCRAGWRDEIGELSLPITWMYVQYLTADL